MQIEIVKTSQLWIGSKFRRESSTYTCNMDETAIIVVDMWDNHHCRSAHQRIVELATPVNEFVKASRYLGASIIHAPSECMDYYHNTRQRNQAVSTRFSPAKVPISRNFRDKTNEPKLPVRMGCSCDTPESCNKPYRCWTRQNELIDVEESDYVTDDGQEVYNILMEQQVNHVIFLGVHVNVCILRRPFGIRQIKKYGIDTSLCRDLTDSYHRSPAPHSEGLKAMIDHIERYLCPTISSVCVTGKHHEFSVGSK